jgi:hypothetical protein
MGAVERKTGHKVPRKIESGMESKREPLLPFSPSFKREICCPDPWMRGVAEFRTGYILFGELPFFSSLNLMEPRTR